MSFAVHSHESCADRVAESSPIVRVTANGAGLTTQAKSVARSANPGGTHVNNSGTETSRRPLLQIRSKVGREPKTQHVSRVVSGKSVGEHYRAADTTGESIVDRNLNGQSVLPSSAGQPNDVVATMTFEGKPAQNRPRNPKYVARDQNRAAVKSRGKKPTGPPLPDGAISDNRKVAIKLHKDAETIVADEIAKDMHNLAKSSPLSETLDILNKMISNQNYNDWNIFEFALMPLKVEFRCACKLLSYGPHSKCPKNVQVICYYQHLCTFEMYEEQGTEDKLVGEKKPVSHNASVIPAAKPASIIIANRFHELPDEISVGEKVVSLLESDQENGTICTTLVATNQPVVAKKVELPIVQMVTAQSLTFEHSKHIVLASADDHPLADVYTRGHSAFSLALDPSLALGHIIPDPPIPKVTVRKSDVVKLPGDSLKIKTLNNFTITAQQLVRQKAILKHVSIKTRPVSDIVRLPGDQLLVNQGGLVVKSRKNLPGDEEGMLDAGKCMTEIASHFTKKTTFIPTHKKLVTSDDTIIHRPGIFSRIFTKKSKFNLDLTINHDLGQLAERKQKKITTVVPDDLIYEPLYLHLRRYEFETYKNRDQKLAHMTKLAVKFEMDLSTPREINRYFATIQKVTDARDTKFMLKEVHPSYTKSRFQNWRAKRNDPGF